MMDYDQTKFTIITINDIRISYCDFCGNICKEEIEIDHRDEYKYYTCSCEKSKEYVNLKRAVYTFNNRLKEIERQHKHTVVINKLIESEIEQVKRKYR